MLHPSIADGTRSVPATLIPRQTRGVEDGAFDADAAVVPGGAGVDLGHAREADADAAGHRRFQRQMAGNFPALGEVGERFHHRFRAAPDEMLWFVLTIGLH